MPVPPFAIGRIFETSAVRSTDEKTGTPLVTPCNTVPLVPTTVAAEFEVAAYKTPLGVNPVRLPCADVPVIVIVLLPASPLRLIPLPAAKLIVSLLLPAAISVPLIENVLKIFCADPVSLFVIVAPEILIPDPPVKVTAPVSP